MRLPVTLFALYSKRSTWRIVGSDVRRHLLCITSLVFAARLSLAVGAARDTALLSAHLATMRGKHWLSVAEYTGLQKEYLAWLDSRVRAGATVKSMNRELIAAGLIPKWPKTADPDAVDEMNKSHAGYVELISEKPVPTDRNIRAIEAGIYKGAGCSLDVTAVLYQRRPLKHLAYVNADPSEPDYAFHTSGFDVGQADSTGRRRYRKVTPEGTRPPRFQPVSVSPGAFLQACRQGDWAALCSGSCGD